jgi:hypothetical protein
MGWPIAAELSSYKLRAKTLSISLVCQSIFNWAIAFVIPYIYNVDAGNLGARTGFIFAVSSVVLVVVSWLIVPDTTGLDTEEIDWLYARNIPARKFNDHHDEMKEHFARESSKTETLEEPQS